MLQPTPSAESNLFDKVQARPTASKWSVQHFQSSDNGALLAKAIIDGDAIAVCDGSYKNGKGSAAWVLEGASSEGRISGYNFPPGHSEAQNSYRSELAGLYGVLVMLKTICSLHKVTIGKITIACDNITALGKLDSQNLPQLSAAEHDFLYAIRRILSALPISYELHHVKGHQDEERPKEDLDRWSILNIEMDTIAKSVLHRWSEALEHQQIEGEPWAVWSNNIKIINDFDARLYEIFHSKQIEEYWIKKRKFPRHMAADIHWEAMKRALTSVPLARRLFITKHATGMCGVGKFMRLWGERDTDSCPRCGAPENASHVWICPQEQATEVWDLSLHKLKEWMVEVGTLPDMRDSILFYLV
jgi:hypothetical protein